MSGRRLSIASVLTALPLLNAVIAVPLPQQSDPAPVPKNCISPTIPPTTGSVTVENTCTFTVLVQSIAGTQIDDIIPVKPGSAYIEDYRTGPAGSGVAIKMIKDSENWSTPMMLEYTPSEDLGQVFYDMSVSLGGKQQGNGGIGNTYELTPSTIDLTTSCVAVNYTNSYTHLGETDYATKSCSLTTSMTLRLC